MEQYSFFDIFDIEFDIVKERVKRGKGNKKCNKGGEGGTESKGDKCNKKESKRDESISVGFVGSEDVHKGCIVNTEEIELKSSVVDLSNVSNNSEFIRILEFTKPVTNNKFISAVALKTYEKIQEDKKEVLEKVNMDYPYKRKEKFMTNAELYLYNFLVENLPSYVVVLPKVRLADVVDVDRRITMDDKYLYKIAYKHIDYLICDAKSLEIICAIELDDYTHEPQERVEADIFKEEVLKICGIKLHRIGFRILSIEKSDIREIENDIYRYYTPKCPLCGSDMVFRESRYEKNYGHRFYGCSKFPKCSKTIDID